MTLKFCYIGDNRKESQWEVEINLKDSDSILVGHDSHSNSIRTAPMLEPTSYFMAMLRRIQGPPRSISRQWGNVIINLPNSFVLGLGNAIGMLGI